MILNIRQLKMKGDSLFQNVVLRDKNCENLEYVMKFNDVSDRQIQD